jgi:ectoine hydroxylase-related dioxygenase (phytanoyl-CoA dioxygenase family)
MTVLMERLPALAEEYPLSETQCAQYRRDGHILLRGVADGEEVAAYRPFIQEAVLKWNRESRKLEDRDTYHKAFLQTSNLWENSEEVKRFVLARRFAKIAADLMGVEGVRLWHDQALFKEAGGGHTPWHQDQFYWPLDTSHTITMWMPLTEAPQESGTLIFASGSHREGSLASLAISDESSVFFRNKVIERNYPLITGDLAPGDATFHSGWTLHKAPGNSAGFTREVITVIYFADGTRVAEPANALQPKDLERWMPGLKPGDLAASPLNPLLYHRDWDR